MTKSPVSVMHMAVSDFAFSTHSLKGHMDYFEPSMTRQEFADECDINILMDRYGFGGITHVNRLAPVYMDVSAVPDLGAALDHLREATIAFNSLPPETRFRMDNDPVKFVAFAQDPANLEQMCQWGLAPPAPVDAPPMAVRVISDAPVAPVGPSAVPPKGA